MTIRLDAHLPEFHRGAPPQLPVRCATTASITIATALNAGDTIDGVTLAAGDRVLVKNQATGSQNGVYIAGPTPARAFDMSEGVAAWGALIYVIAGTTNGGQLWVNTNTTLPTIDTTALTWSQFASGGSSLTVQDEGTPLATAATALNFVGSGVSATGAGATKTITIPGLTGTGASAVFIGAKVYNSASQSIPSATTTLLTWDSEELDSSGFHSTSSNTGRLTIPASFDGVYLVLASIEIGSDSAGDRALEITLNGSTTVAYRQTPAGSSGLVSVEVAVILQLAAGDYVTARVTQNASGSLTVSAPVQDSSLSIAQLAVGSGGGAPDTADYLVGTAQAGLSAEIVVGTTPGGELGGTWSAPTVDATHSGSAHSDFIAKSVLTTQDDIIVRDGTGPARLAKGTDGQVLTVDPTTHHLKWSTPTAGSAPDVKENGSVVVAAATALDFGNGLDITAPGGGIAGIVIDPSELALDTLGTPTDITTLNASTSRHGLLRKLDNSGAHFLDGQGNWSTPSGTGASVLVEPFFGDGRDGDVTISVDTTIARDMYYNNLTVNAGVVLSTALLRVFVKGTLTLNGTIRCNGNNGTNGGDGTGAAGGAAGAAGVQQAGGSQQTLPNGAAGRAGAIGGINANGSGNTAGSTTTYFGINVPAGGAGGVSGSGRSGGSGGAAGVGNETIVEKPLVWPAIISWTTLANAAINQAIVTGNPAQAGSGGGAAAAGGGGSGGSGSSGGTVVVCARTITGSGTIQAKGGNGGNGGNGFAGGQAGGGAAGNGGQGGLITLIYKDASGWSGTLDVSGGSHGTGGAAGGGSGSTGGGNGNDGNAGRAFAMQLG